METQRSSLGSDAVTPGRQRGQGAPRRGRLFQLLWPLTSYLVPTVTVTVFWVLFFVLNRTTIIGRHHVGEGGNTLLPSRPHSMLDSLLAGPAAFYPRLWLK